MPKSFKDCVASVKAQGKTESSAYAVCTSTFMKKYGMTPAEAEKKGMMEDVELRKGLGDELLIQKLGIMDSIIASLTDEDLKQLSEEDELELAELLNTSVDGQAVALVWSAPTKRKDVPDSHFFWPEEKKYPYRNADGSINCEGVMAAWRMAQGARSGKKAPPNIMARMKMKHDSCLMSQKKASQDVYDPYVRQFAMPDHFCLNISPSVKFSDDIEFNDDTKKIDIQVLKLGTFQHPDHGKLEFTPKTFENFIKNFEEKVPQEHIAYDFKHRPDWGAAAWVRKLFTKDDGLWASVELTKRGFESLTGKEFLFFSTEYTDEYQDRATGKKFGPTIIGGGLTNRPFIKGMAPAILSEDGEIVLSPVGDKKNNPGKEDESAMLNQILKELNDLKAQLVKLNEGKDDGKNKAFIEKLEGQIKSLEDKAKALDTKEDPKVKELSDAKIKLEGEVKVLSDTVKTLMQKDEANVRRLYEQGVENFCKELEGKGFFPATVAVAKSVLMAVPNKEHGAVTLSEKVEGQDKPKETTLSIKDVIDRILESVPEDHRLDLSEETHQHVKKGSASGMTVREIEDYAEKHKLSFKDAIIKLTADGKISV